MRRHLAVGPVHLRVIEAGLDHRDLGVVGNQEPGRAAEVGEGLDVGVDPVGELLCPAGVGEAEAGAAHHRHEDMRAPRRAGPCINDHRHSVAGVVDEQLVAAQVGLAHGDRQPRLPAAVEVAEPAVAIAVRVGVDVLVPQDLQGDVLALQLAVQRRPVGLHPPAVALLGSALAIEPRLQIGVGHVQGQPPCQPRPLEAPEHLPQRRGRHPRPPRHLAGRQAGVPAQSQYLAHAAHRDALRRHRSLQKEET
jgi:hypothetical protein